jgi:hypothetical protein
MRVSRVYAAIAAGILPLKALAINWEVEPRISAIASYVDNVSLRSFDQQSDTVYQANPAIKLTGQGRRLNVDLDYGLQIVRFRANSEADNTYQQGSGRLNWTTKNNIFSVTATAFRGQQAASFTGTLPPNLESISDNRTTATSYSLIPRFQYRFDGTAQFALQGSYSRVDYDGGNVTDSRAEDRGYTATLSSGSNFRRFNWSLNRNYREFNIDEPGRDDRSEQNTLTLGYLVSSTLRWFGSVGQDNIVSQGVEVFQDNGYWETGLEWNPSSRTRLRASTGDRAFGKSSNVQFSRRGRHSQIEVGYSEDVTSQSLQQAFRFRTPTSAEGGVQDITVIGTVDEIFVSKRADVRLTLNGRRNDVTIRAYDEQREFLSSSIEEQYRGGSLGWDHDMGRHLNFNTGLSYSRRTVSDSPDVNKYITFDATLRREIYRNVDVAAGYSHNRQESNAGTDFRQNIIRLSATARF